MKTGPILWMPCPRQMRAGAVWITAENWLLAAQRRYGQAEIVTADGVLNADGLRRATSFHGSSRKGKKPTRSRVLLETLVKDVRWAARDLRVRLQPPRAPASIGPFVWQHHDLFQTGGGQLARRLKLPLVQFVDAPWVWESAKWGTTRPGWGSLVEQIGERRELHRADLVLCVSDEVGEEIVRMGVSPDRLLVTPCTANPDDHLNVPDLRDAQGLQDKVVVGWMGSFRGFHRLDLLIDAVAVARENRPNLVLLLVGDGAEREAILELARSRGIEVVAPGAVAHDEIPAWLALMDLATLPAAAGQSFHYSPLKLKEYMAAGRAVVAPRLGEMARVLQHGEDAMLYDAGDVAGLAKIIGELADDSELRRRLGERAIDTVRQSFSVDAQLAAVVERLGVA